MYNKMLMNSAGFDPATLRVLISRDNQLHHESKYVLLSFKELHVPYNDAGMCESTGSFVWKDMCTSQASTGAHRL
jgi:hypothetical protein